MNVVTVARSEKAVEMAAACLMPMTKGIKDIETSPKPNPVRPWTKPAQINARPIKDQFIYQYSGSAWLGVQTQAAT